MRARLVVAIGICLAALVIGQSAAGAQATRSAGPGLAVAPPPPARAAQQRRMEAVVRAWSKRLNAGDNAGVARLFTLPALLIQGPYAYGLKTRAEIAEWHAGLPCSGRILSISFRGIQATAVFRLGDRGRTACDAPGTLAAARFKIVNGKIAVWEQVAVPEQAGGQPA